MKRLFADLPFAWHVLLTIGLIQELIKRDPKVTYRLMPEWANEI